MNREEWLKERQKGVGASESAALFGLHPYESPLSLWAKKVGDAEIVDEPTEYQERGLALEPYLCSRYEKETGRKTWRPAHLAIYRHKAIISATPDAFFETDGEWGSRVGPNGGVLQLKSWMHYSSGSEIEAYAQIQIQQEMLCTDSVRGSFSIDGAFGKHYCVNDIERNDEFLKLLIEKIEEFWDLVRRGVPPPADGHKATTEALRRLYPKDSGASIQLSENAAAITEELEAVKKRLKALEAQEAYFENVLKAEMADATTGILPDGTGWTLKHSKRKSYTVAETEFRALRRTTKKLLLAS